MRSVGQGVTEALAQAGRGRCPTGCSRARCPAHPVCEEQADHHDHHERRVERRKRVIQREKDFNAILRSTCEAYVRCRSDADAVFGTSFTTGDISPRDYFHPSLVGQKRLAAVTWTAWGLGTP